MTAIKPQRFAYSEALDLPGLQAGMPILPIALSHQDRSRLLLGQMNFFQHFDAWFSGTQQTFVLSLSSKP